MTRNQRLNPRLKLMATTGLFLAIIMASSLLSSLSSTTARADSAGKEKDVSVLTCPTLDKIQQVFFNQHIIYKEPNDTIEARTIAQYIKHIDSAKIYLLDSDRQEIEKDMRGIFVQLSQGDCSALDKVEALFEKRVADRAEYAKKVLANKAFKFEPKTELVLDPDSRKFPKKKSDADAFQSKYLQFQISNYLATGMKQDEAQEQVVRNYDRVLKRVKETSKEDIYSGYLDSFGRALDPHSSFFSRDVLEDFEIQMGLSLEGIGATLSSQDGFTVIEQLIDGGSAKSSGKLMAQDKIVAVAQFKNATDVSEMENVVEMDLRDVVRRIRGPAGSKVRLQVLRKKPDGTNERLVVDLTRDKIKLEEDAASLTVIDKEVNGEKKKVALLNLPSFYAEAKRGGRSCATDMKKLIKEARDKGAEAMVLDLSNNGGGSLDDAVKIAGLFFRTGNVVKQSSRDSANEATLDDRDPEVDWAGPLVVLTSRVSASASEIVSGTLKDYDRAVIVGGDHTFGKGSVQSVVPLPPGLGAVKVTVGMFFTPGGYSTQHRGVVGDVVLPGPYSTPDMGEDHLDYSLPAKKIGSFLSPEAFVASGPGAWKKVDAPTIAQLKSRSQVRVSKNAEFQKIIDELKKGEKRGKVIKLADSLKETKEKKDEADQKKTENKEQKTAEYVKRADVQEAANVAADLLALSKGIVLTDASLGTSDDNKKTR